MAGGGLSVKDIKHADIYSCFPVAVEIAAKEIGLNLNGRLKLSVTGGLPYHGTLN
jgi:acetyl-CoA C-acetyltransferase